MNCNSMILTLQETMIGTAQCGRTPCYEICLPLQEAQTPEYRSLSARWTVVTDHNGNHQLQMQWRVDHAEEEMTLDQK